MTAASTPARRRRPRTDRLTTVWMILALVAAALAVLARDVVPQLWWTTIHLVTLGVLTNGILQWSWYFARGVLKLPPNDVRSGRDAGRRSIAFNIVLVALIASVWADIAPVAVAAAGALGAVVAWHGFALTRSAREALGPRFGIVIRFYAAASALFVVGCIIAGALTISLLSADAPQALVEAHDRLALTHAIVMVCGWLGLAIAGTLMTLGPTTLRTRIDDAAVPLASRALPWLVLAVVVAAAGVFAEAQILAALALGAYGIGLAAWVGVPLARAALKSGPREFPAWSFVAAIAWAGIGVVVFAVSIARSPDAAAAHAALEPWIPLLGAAAFAQLFIGALSYLLPVVVGGGPTPVRTGIATVELLGTARLVIRNLALVALAVTTGLGSPARGAWWVLVLMTFAVDIGLLAAAGVRQGRARRAHRDDAFVGIGMPTAAPRKEEP